MNRLWKQWIYFAFGVCVGFVADSFIQPASFVDHNNDSQKLTTLNTGRQGGISVVKEDAEKLLLNKEPKILCWIMTHKNNTATKGKAVENTWGKRCDLLLFASDGEASVLNTLPIHMTPGREHLSNKTLLTFQYIYEKFIDDYDWFLKADDDTYVIMENLKYFLSQQNPDDGVYFGHLYNPWVNQGYFSGGAGYVISREALRRFGQRESRVKECHARYGRAEDVVFGQCMAALKVRTGESRDKYGRSRFHSMSLGDHVTGNFAEWYYFYDGHKGQKGAESISDFPISFHYVKPREMYVFELLIYKLRVHRSNSEDVNIPSNSTQSC